MDGDVDALLAEQRDYYRAAAAEYDRPYERVEELRDLLAFVDELPVIGDVLELACGTGQWTARLAERARSVTAVDAAAEVLALARVRTESPTVRFLEADLFEWQPPRRYDTVFFAFWLSHVPPSRFADFWSTVAAALAPGGKAIFIDDGPAAVAATEEEVLANLPVPAALRRLDDGSQYRIVKVFHDVRTLTDDLTALGWSVRIRPVAWNFIGIAEPPTAVG
ncbi:class I SAM-dependent methyltransferase [Streptomyces roseochromogenus]|uniref:Methyltransferase type 11 n=1 Tax=Streptomyces roseochromogenus subsp. oscitans DS 12.976 TaxID=1352936 RepID=V6JGM2_STRRC|nr:class I SAM-dependent methyltransferase [Streptomyces roseochromogenus]EST19057.1 methyltransferase type 11 [Streptomyces roseochromogenus subsp. oscitans DS 12.976]